VNDFKGGLSYAYFLQAGKDLFINAGLSASVYHRGYNFNNVVLPEQIDIMGGVTYPASEPIARSGKSVLDLGAGLFVISGKIMGGFSISHLTEPDLAENGLANERVSRKFLIHLSGSFGVGDNQSIRIRPVTFLSLQQRYLSGAGGVVFETDYLSINTILLDDNSKNLNLQTGLSLKSGRVTFFYNYRFNIESGNSLLPFSLLHQAGLAISLNDVDKKSTIKTIKFPKL
jgi:hypothetical protein